MASYLALLIVVSFCYARSSEVTPNCEQMVAVAYLDAALDMIAKSKDNFQDCVNCENNLTRGALDCSELLRMGYDKSGVYKIWPSNRLTEDKSIEVFCDMETDGGGWTLIQRRGNFQRPADYFHKDWKSYKEGFGDVEKDFWLGNDNIFALTNQKLCSARFDLRDMEGNPTYAHYDEFWFDDENHQYTLHIADYTGDAGDSMIENHNNQMFSTKDREHVNLNCTEEHKGGWWYNSCDTANLNGFYLRGNRGSVADGVVWKTFKGYYKSMESTEIKIRPKNFRLHSD